MTAQLPLFPLPAPSGVPVTVSRDASGQWRAEIDGGWWTATGATAAEAAQRCADAYYNETEKIT